MSRPSRDPNTHPAQSDHPSDAPAQGAGEPSDARRPRPRCSAFIATSLDGAIARADGRIDWLAAVQSGTEDYGFSAFFESVDVLLIGRKTYDTVLSFEAWPYGGKRCVVLTHRPPAAERRAEFASGPLEPLLERLHAEGARRVYVDGGEVITQFLQAGLLDDLTLSLVPIVLGGGRPLFAAATPEQRLILLACRHWPTGLVQLEYRLGPLGAAPGP